jgi:hypothetical protein
VKSRDALRMFKGRPRRTALAAMLAVVSGLAIAGFAFGHSSRSAAPPSPEGPVLAKLREVAAHVASLNGVPHPTGAIAIPSTRKAANTVDSGADVDTDQPSYLIVLHGRFVGRVAHVPPGAPLPRGSVLTIVVDADTGLVTDWGISDHKPDTSSLGKETPLGDL